MFIALDNGRWVQDPVFYGKEWFLKFLDEEADLFVHVYRNPSEEGLRKRARRILRDAGIAAKLVSTESQRVRSPFPPNWNGIKDCAILRIELAPLPIPSTLECHASIYTSIKPKEILNERSVESPGQAG
jgi:hypothetical protein